MLLCMHALVDNKMNVNAWIIMHGCVLVDSKIVAWIIMHGNVLVDSKMDYNAWLFSCG